MLAVHNSIHYRKLQVEFFQNIENAVSESNLLSFYLSFERKFIVQFLINDVFNLRHAKPKDEQKSVIDVCMTQ